MDPQPAGHRDPRQRRQHRRLRRHRHRQLRGARPARRLARRPRLPRDGRRRGALHQEQVVPALAARAAALRAHPVPHRPAAADGPHRHPADQRHRGLPGHLAVPRLDRRQEAARPADGRAGGDRADPRRARVLPRGPPVRGRPRDRPPPQGRRGRRHPRPPRRRPPGRARRPGRPVDPGGRARARPTTGGALREGAGDAHVGRGRRGHRPRPGAPGRHLGARGHLDEDRRERLQHDAAHRPGQGRSRRRLRGAAGAQRRQGRLLRQAHRRDGRRGGDLRQARHPVLVDPR